MKNQNSKSQKPKDPSDDELNIGGDVSKSVIIKGNGNVVNIKENMNSRKKETNRNKKKNPLIAVAWIGFLGAVLAALIGTVGANPNLLTGTAGVEVIASLTTTATSTTTATLNPNEPTPEATLTSTPIPSVALGNDWGQGCISKLWSTYPTTVLTEDKGNGCWQEPIHAFSAENGNLDFLFERQNGDEEIYGLFAPLPTTSGSVTFTIRLKDLSNADLLLGIFAQPEVKSTGLLMIMLNGDVSRNVFIQKNPITYETMQGTQNIDQGNGYSITFRFDDLSVRSIVNPAVFFTDSFSLPASQKWLFLGYKGLKGDYRIEGSFSNFELKE